MLYGAVAVPMEEDIVKGKSMFRIMRQQQTLELSNWEPTIVSVLGGIFDEESSVAFKCGVSVTVEMLKKVIEENLSNDGDWDDGEREVAKRFESGVKAIWKAELDRRELKAYDIRERETEQPLGPELAQTVLNRIEFETGLYQVSVRAPARYEMGTDTASPNTYLVISIENKNLYEDIVLSSVRIGVGPSFMHGPNWFIDFQFVNRTVGRLDAESEEWAHVAELLPWLAEGVEFDTTNYSPDLNIGHYGKTIGHQKREELEYFLHDFVDAEAASRIMPIENSGDDSNVRAQVRAQWCAP
jgi:hypothetical protein